MKPSSIFNREIWRQIINYIPECVVCSDSNGKIIMANAAALKLLAYSHVELEQLKVLDLFSNCAECHIESKNNLSCFLSQEAHNRPTSRPCEVELMCHDGNSIPVILTAVKINDPANAHNSLNILYFKDIRTFKSAQQDLAEEKNRFETLFNNISDAVFLASINKDGMHGNFLQVNDAACERLGYSREELLELNARTINPLSNLGKVKAFGRNIKREEKAIFESIHETKDGTQIPVNVVAKIVDINGKECVLSVVRDLREHKQLQQAESRIGRLMDYSWDEIYVFDNDSLMFIQVNQGARDNLGYSKNELYSIKITQITPKISDVQFRDLTKPLFDGSKNILIYETIHKRKNGSSYPVEVRLQLSHSDVPPVFLANVQDISERKKTERHLQFLARYDSLTKLPNRSLFLDRLNIAIENCNRSNTLIAVFFIDLDGFKTVNDTFGHDVGDRLITLVGKRLKNCVRKSDTVARLGGDEFTVILTNLNNVQGAENVAEKIIQVMKKPFTINSLEIVTSSSIGITFYPFTDNDYNYSLLKQADSAMYQAKNSGKNNYKFYSSMVANSALKKTRIEQAVRHALENGELCLHYQPRINLKNDSVNAAEALLRWTNPVLGAISPVDFIPIMESTGIIHDVGIWVLKEACQQLCKWQSKGLSIRLSINVSARQFEDGLFFNQLKQTILNTDVYPQNLEIEITEGLLIANDDDASKTLISLKNIGVSIALDDFGSGYSSLNYLKQFPIDIIKIDRSFIMDLGNNNDSTVIVESIIDLAHKLRLLVTAEGIETPQQLDFLKQRNCDEGQGYYFAKAMTAKQFEEFILRYRNKKQSQQLPMPNELNN